MKKLLFLAGAVVMSAFAFAQKTIHDPNVEVRNISSFTAIEVSGGIDLYLSYGDEAAAVSAKDEKTRSRIKTEVKNGVLKIYYDSEGFRITMGNNYQLKAYVSYKTLKSVDASGGSDVKVDGKIKSSSLRLEISGGSDFSGKVEVDQMDIEQSGGADINISGTARKLTIDASGGSDLDGYDLVSDECTVEASGGSDVTITVTKTISAEASGGSDVYWKGGANIIKSETSGSGSVSHRS
jgi:hypothetical protein